MARTRKSGLVEEDDSKSSSRSESKFVFSDSDDDAEANEDLSLKIIQKAISRSSHREGKNGAAVRDSEVVGGGGGQNEDIVMTELVALDSVNKKIKKEKKERKKKVKKIKVETQTVNIVPLLLEGQNTETIEDLDAVKLSEEGDAKSSNNAVLRRLLRGPRYFDPPDSSWGTCYNCGEEGHSAVNCKSAKRKKPCFVCGSFEHGAKNCQKGKDCFICNVSGHRAKDCPKKFKRCSQRSDLCLRCGSSGHDMSACNYNYPPGDLKEIQCYVCKSFGHLCCANYFGTMPCEVSCYKCGRFGHTGLSCRGSHGETAGEGTPASCFKCGEEGHFARECLNPYKASRTSEGTPSSCYKCGKEGHFARECITSVKDKKRSRDMSTPKKKASKENKAYKGYRSAPQDLGKAHKKKRLQFDDENTTNSSKRRAYGGWIMDDPVDFPRGRGAANGGWQSSSAQNGRDYRTSNPNFGRHPSTPPSARRYVDPYPSTPSSQRSRSSFQNGHSAALSRFRSPSSGYRSNNSHKYF